jgi:hypothetical protein
MTTYYVQFERIGGGFKVEADTPQEAMQKAKQMAIDAIDDDIKQDNVLYEIWNLGAHPFEE